MKAKDAHDSLKGYTGDDLYQQARQLYEKESDFRIALRAHDRKPTLGVVDSVVSEMKDWFRKVAEGLSWENPELPENIISWKTSDIWVKYEMVDPEIEHYQKKVKAEILKGSPAPLLAALTPKALDAISGMMISSMAAEAGKYFELVEARKNMAESLGKRVCPRGEEERFCKHQETYSMVEGLPTDVDDVVFVCTVEKCIKEP